jgi:hypothetical protein
LTTLPAHGPEISPCLSTDSARCLCSARPLPGIEKPTLTLTCLRIDKAGNGGLATCRAWSCSASGALQIASRHGKSEIGYDASKAAMDSSARRNSRTFSRYRYCTDEVETSLIPPPRQLLSNIPPLCATSTICFCHRTHPPASPAGRSVGHLSPRWKRPNQPTRPRINLRKIPRILQMPRIPRQTQEEEGSGTERANGFRLHLRCRSGHRPWCARGRRKTCLMSSSISWIDESQDGSLVRSFHLDDSLGSFFSEEGPLVPRGHRGALPGAGFN